MKNINTKTYWDDVYKKEGQMDPNYRNDKFSWGIVLASINKTGKLLDAGCGSGYLLSFLQEHRPNVEYFGVDLSHEGIELTKKRVYGVFKQADLEELPFENDYFDSVCTTEVLEHLTTPQKAIKEISRVLKSDGVCVALFPNENTIPSPEHVQVYTKEYAKEIFSDWFTKVNVNVVKHPAFVYKDNDGNVSPSEMIVVEAKCPKR